MHSIPPAVLSFWGKARPAEGSSHAFHPLVCHSLDVAAVAIELGSPVEALPASTLAFLVALHDIGKFSSSFQAKARAVWPAEALGPFQPTPADPGHDTSGFALLREQPLSGLLAPVFPGWRPRWIDWLLRAVTGHHGRPPGERRPPTEAQIGMASRHAATTCVTAFRDLLAPEAVPPELWSCHGEALSWHLAGLTTLADWIGSSARHFPYVSPEEAEDLTGYWRRAREAARKAVAATGLAPARAAPFDGLAPLLPEIRQPSPLQRWAAEVELPEGPALAVLEDMTGAGKTEAALVLTQRLLAEGRADGLFVALPTMATANAMYRRMAAAYRRLFAQDAMPSLALAHGRANLDAGFTASILSDAADAEAPAGPDPAEESAGAQCAAWLADDRRKALLAQVGVGTIDQALLAVLPVRHAPLRQRGLVRKVLVIDEAHAFDPYMQEELARLLQFHAALGGSAILLSATLPLRLRQRLADAWRAGLKAPPAPLSAMAYPLASLVAEACARECPVASRHGTERHVPVARVGTEVEAVARIRAAVERGAAVAWVRNTVDEAIVTAEALRAEGLQPMLFHARFAMADRLRIEDEVLARFGKDGDPAQRQGVLVATQVIEQSLDLDFDLMVTDLAPADLLIQRAGRLWRHGWREARPLDGPELLVLAPEPVAEPGVDWLAEHPGTAAVYRDPARLWRGVRALFAAGAIVAPEGLRALIEAAAEGEEPEGLRRAAEEAEAKRLTAMAQAEWNLLDFKKGYAEGTGLWASEERTPTRLEEWEQVTLRLARLRDGEVVPYAKDMDERRAWALSEVTAAKHRVGEVEVPAAHRAAAEMARAQWGRWERDSPRIRLALLTSTIGKRMAITESRLSYDPRTGLLLTDTEADRKFCGI